MTPNRPRFMHKPLHPLSVQAKVMVVAKVKVTIQFAHESRRNENQIRCAVLSFVPQIMFRQRSFIYQSLRR